MSGVVRQLGTVDEENTRLKRRVDAVEATNRSLKSEITRLERRVDAVEATNHSLDSELMAVKAAASLLKGQVRGLQAPPTVVYQTPSPGQRLFTTPSLPTQPPSATTTPVATRRKKDFELQPYSDGDELEKQFRFFLHDASADDKRKALSSHNGLWRFLLRSYYKVDSVIAELKLPPIAGATKVARNNYSQGLYHYIDVDIVTILVKLARENFPHAFNDNRAARKGLNYLLDNMKSKIREENSAPILDMTNVIVPPVQVQCITPLPQPSMQPIRDLDSDPMASSLFNLNCTATTPHSDSSFGSGSGSFIEQLFRP